MTSPAPGAIITTMDFHEFPTVHSVLKRNWLVEETADRFYAGALTLLRGKAMRHTSHALAASLAGLSCSRFIASAQYA